MGLDLDNINGQTPLEEDEKEGLLIPTIATREELDEFEQQNIEEAMLWVFSRSVNAGTILTEKFICNLHKRMFGDVWAWAGKFRKTDKNLGIDKWQIPVALKKLCDDALYWIHNETFTADEMALRFKHGIVSIHCFANGNGRHSRLMADIIINTVYKMPLFSWGSDDLLQDGKGRSDYLKAVRAADNGNFEQLLRFARS
ncbi:MAG: mobile mystery protein B [Cryomorphaceae bacterium]|nr:mobile mystery protein B [Flavobacteriales bacterium]